MVTRWHYPTCQKSCFRTEVSLADGKKRGYQTVKALAYDGRKQLESTIPTNYSWEQTKALAAIHEAGREIAASLDLERTLRLVMQKAAETLPMDAGVLFVRNEALQRYVVAVSHNIPPEHEAFITFAFNEGVPGWAIQHRQPLIIEDARLDSRVHPNVVSAGVLSVLAVPLISREKIVGVLNLFCQGETHAFDAAALQLAQVFADQAAVLDNIGNKN
jgi:GAF domain-containing protein